MKPIFVGDIVIIRAKTKLILTGNTSLIIKYEKPDKSTGYWTASIDPDDVMNAQYMTIDGELDIHGTWRAQSYAKFVDWQNHGDWFEFKVYKPLC